MNKGAISPRPAMLLAVVLVASLPLSSCYLLSQGATLLSHQRQAEPVGRILGQGSMNNGDALLPETTIFLKEVERVRRFAIDTLGLVDSGNYTSFVPTDREYLADVVNAVQPLSFERYEWWWPFVGRLPYKGYYRRDAALRLARRLERKGLDVWVRPVDAFSTLGVLEDPLYQFMVDYDRYTIAELMIHEQAHATLFLPGHAQFNEEFATFVGYTGAAEYLRVAGAAEAEIQRAEDQRTDRWTARSLLLDLRANLDSVYGTDLPDAEKLAAKHGTILDFQARLRSDYDQLFRTDLYLDLPEMEINNAYIDLYVSYSQDLELFELLYIAEGRRMRAFLEALDVLKLPRRIPDRDARRLARNDPKAFIRSYLLDSTSRPSVEW